MEDTYSPCERDEETGEVLDPVYYTPIPEDRLIVVREGSGVWCMDALVLLKNMVLYRNTTNPLTRTELSADVLKQIEEYRFKQLRLVVVVNDAESVTGDNRWETFVFNSFDLIGDVIVKVARKQGHSRSIVSVLLAVEGRSLYTLDLDSDLTEYEPITVMHCRDGSLTESEYGKIKEFVSKYDRYKYLFSPFPARVEARASSATVPSRIPTALSRSSTTTPIVPTVSTVRQGVSTASYTGSNGPFVTIQRGTRAAPHTTPYTEGTRPRPASGADLVWAPAPWGYATSNGWNGWHLVRSDSIRTPADYDGSDMLGQHSDAILEYNSSRTTWLDSRQVGTLAEDMISRGEALPYPDTLVSRQLPRHTFNYNVVLAWVPAKGNAYSSGEWSDWKLLPINTYYEYPPGYNGSAMESSTISRIERYNATSMVGEPTDLRELGSPTSGVVSSMVRERLDGMLPLPLPVRPKSAHWILIKLLRGTGVTIYKWDVSFNDSQFVLREYNGEAMDIPLANEIRAHNGGGRTIYLLGRVGPIAQKIVREGGTLPDPDTIVRSSAVGGYSSSTTSLPRLSPSRSRRPSPGRRSPSPSRSRQPSPDAR